MRWFRGGIFLPVFYFKRKGLGNCMGILIDYCSLDRSNGLLFSKLHEKIDQKF